MSDQRLTRRNVAKKLGTGILGIASLSGVGAASKTKVFDPYDFEEVANFAEDLEHYSSPWRRAILSHLSDTEVEALSDMMKPGLESSKSVKKVSTSEASISGEGEEATITKEVKKTHKTSWVGDILEKWDWKDNLSKEVGTSVIEEESFATTDDLGSVSQRIKYSDMVTATNVAGYNTLYEFEHSISFDYNRGDIKYKQARSEIGNLTWAMNYDGLVKDKQNFRDKGKRSADEYVSDKVGKFTQSGPIVGRIYTGYPHISLKADGRYTSTVEKGVKNSNVF